MQNIPMGYGGKKFRIAVIGDWKNGKSTLINAILGARIMTCPVLPTSNLRKEIKWGREKKVHLHFKNPQPNAVFETVHPDVRTHTVRYRGQAIPPMALPYEAVAYFEGIDYNREQNVWMKEHPCSHFEIFFSGPLLERGVEIIEHSGGFTDRDARTSRGLFDKNLLADADAVVFVLNAARLCGGMEMEFANRCLMTREPRSVFFVINGMDNVQPNDVGILKRYAQNKLAGYCSRIYYVSAANGLSARLSGNAEKYRASGVYELEAELMKLAQNKLCPKPTEADQAKNTGNTAAGTVSEDEVADEEEYAGDADSLDIDEHLGYVSGIVNNRIKDANEKSVLGKKLDEILQKHNDKLLNMSVIGEFSSGKSTFINALIRSELLSSCSLQGTTVANTVIEYGEDYRVTVRYKGTDEAVTRVYSSSEDMGNEITLLTTEPEKARNITSVSIALPVESIKGKFRIIDTPGTNSMEVWHEDVTKEAMNTLSDISVILVDATKPFPETLCNFVKENLKNVLSRCVFVLTKFDNIPAKERKMMLSYAVKKVKMEFGIESPTVLPYCATVMLGGDTENDLYGISRDSEEKLVEHMAKQKELAQALKLVALVDGVYDALERNMNLLSAECDAELELLNKSRHIPLDGFIAKQKSERSRDFMGSAERIKAETLIELKNGIPNRVNAVLDKLDGKDTFQAIREFLGEPLKEACREQELDIRAGCENKAKEITECYRRVMATYEAEFMGYFKNMNLLARAPVNFRYAFDRQGLNSVTVNTVDASNYINEQEKDTSVKVLGGTAGGAAIGTMLLPGVGTVIGAIGGLLYGAMRSPSTENIRTETKKRLRPKLESYFTEIENNLSGWIDEYVKRMSNNLMTDISAYYVSYNATVDQLIKAEQEKKDRLEKKKAVIAVILKNITKRKSDLLSYGSKLNENEQG